MTIRLRLASLLAILPIACTPAVDQPQAEEGATPIACALDGATQFEKDCLAERSVVDGIRVVTVRHPDGGFRRFEQTDDGLGLIAFDGAEPASRELLEGFMEVRVAEDRYRFPVKVGMAGDGS